MGYRQTTTGRTVPLFPFGHGLSYTTFSYGDAELGSRQDLGSGDVRLSRSRSPTPGRAQAATLCRSTCTTAPAWSAGRAGTSRGFAKVRLAPGETKRTHITLSPRAFAFYDAHDRAAGAIR